MSIQPKSFYAFGPFRLDSGERVLLRDGMAVPLTPKVAETLLVLVENAGHRCGKDELLRRVWPDAFVEEGNLSKNIYTLRKLLGQSDDGREYIETLSKRGYRFIAAVKRVGNLTNEGELSRQPTTEPENRVTSIGEGLRPSQARIAVALAPALSPAWLSRSRQRPAR
jgi:DNA-binding winged helix-turn-helix (wHTH) protein